MAKFVKEYKGMLAMRKRNKLCLFLLKNLASVKVVWIS